MSEISEKAIKLIKDLRRDISIDIMFTPEKNAEDDSLKALVDYIAELEAALTNARELVGMTPPPAFPEWIPVSERLPLLRDSKAVLVYTKSGETYSGLYLGNNEWTGLLHDFREGEVTHWMPLPSTPEVQE